MGENRRFGMKNKMILAAIASLLLGLGNQSAAFGRSDTSSSRDNSRGLGSEKLPPTRTNTDISSGANTDLGSGSANPNDMGSASGMSTGSDYGTDEGAASSDTSGTETSGMGTTGSDPNGTGSSSGI